MGLVNLHGEMGINMKDNGLWENRMEKGSIFLQMGIVGKVFGKKVNEFNGIDLLIYILM